MIKDPSKVNPLWRRRLESKTREAWKDIIWLTTVQKVSLMKKRCNKIFISEALEIAKQRLTAVVIRLKVYNTEANNKIKRIKYKIEMQSG